MMDALTGSLPFLRSARVWNIVAGAICLAFVVMWRFPRTLAIPFFACDASPCFSGESCISRAVASSETDAYVGWSGELLSMSSALLGLGCYAPDYAQYHMALWTGRSWILQLVVAWVFPFFGGTVWRLSFLVPAWLGFGGMFLWSEYVVEYRV